MPRAVLQIVSPALGRLCRTFDDLGIVDPIQISIHAEDPAVAPDAQRLFDRLLSSLQAMARPARSSPSYCPGPCDPNCRARKEPSCRSVLVPVTGAVPVSSNFATLMDDWTRTRPANSVVLPILPNGSDASTVLPKTIARLTVLFNSGAIEQLAPDVLRAAGVGGREHRLFISYRRKDAQELAQQLHDRFTHAGFHVFLDRFRGSPGTPFPAQLRRELADKGVVLVIESPRIRKSHWTLAEVSFAASRHLGLFALHLPRGARFGVIPRKDRIVPSPADWRTLNNGRRILRAAPLRNVIDFVRQRYAEHALSRQLYLENLLHGALHPHGLIATAAGGGAFAISAKNNYVVQLSPRLPELGELRRAVTHARTTSAHAVLVGASRLLAPEDADDFAWTASELVVQLRAEAAVRHLAKSFSKGKVPP